MVVVDHDEREVALERGVGLLHRAHEIAVVMALDEVHDDLGVGLRRERVALGDERVLELAVVLDDPVEHDREPPFVAAGERVRVVLGHAAVRRPARVPEPVTSRASRCRPAARLQLLQVADRAHVVERVVLAQRDACRVVAAVLEPLEPLKEERLRGSWSDVSDDPAHRKSPLEMRRARLSGLPPSEASAELSSYERGDRSREFAGLSLSPRLREEPDDGLRARGPDEDARAAVQLGVQPLNLLEQRCRERAVGAAGSPSPAGTSASPPPPRRACGRGSRRRAAARRRGRRR